jgi:putative phosphoribosyl transferase
MPFLNRIDAGRRLSERLRDLVGSDVVVLGLPRGGVPVAYEVARALGAPLDVIVVRKLGLPSQPEFAMGAIGEGAVRVVDAETVRLARISPMELAAVEGRERKELERRARAYRGERARLPLVGRTALIVDDGIATGSTALAACQVARAEGASRVILAAPVAPRDVAAGLCEAADELIVLTTPPDFHSVGQYYADFGDTSDEEVVELLARAGAGPALALDGDAERLDMESPVEPLQL